MKHERTINKLREWIDDNEGVLKYQNNQMDKKVAELAELKQWIDEIKSKIEEYRTTLTYLEAEGQ